MVSEGQISIMNSDDERIAKKIIKEQQNKDIRNALNGIKLEKNNKGKDK